MDKKDRIDIKCKKANSIADVDKAHEKEWCFYTVAPMYYYNEIDLRNLAYGSHNKIIDGKRVKHNYIAPPPMSYHAEEFYQEGRDFIVSRWNEEELEDAQKEIKPETN